MLGRPEEEDAGRLITSCPVRLSCHSSFVVGNVSHFPIRIPCGPASLGNDRVALQIWNEELALGANLYIALPAI